ncbi:MAG: SAM-dependent methyltransferase [Moraxellaceae bacterium]|nr:MAG: SAM-dependent methyltransferase [Moraxellaceae bacterium]
MTDDELRHLLEVAWHSRQTLMQRFREEGTDCFRLFHGTAEGLPGVSIDCYGSQLLIQSFHFSLQSNRINTIESFYQQKLPQLESTIYHDRSPAHSRRRSPDTYDERAPIEGEELGVTYQVDVKRLGQDPLLFLDMRVGRQWMLDNAAGKSVLNLFSYTCGIGICASKAGAKTVWNVDFSASALAVGESNALINGLDLEKMRFIQSDCFPALKQLAGIPITARQKKSKNGRRVKQALPDYPRLPSKQFDLVFMDPPRWAKSPFGTVDLVRDYQSLFKPALMATKVGGNMVVCNNVAKVDRDSWLAQLVRCGEKNGRKVEVVEMLQPENDFPSYDGIAPLKIAVLKV